MAGLDPAIHEAASRGVRVDARVKPGHDVEWRAGGRERIL